MHWSKMPTIADYPDPDPEKTALLAERDALKAALRELVEAATPFAYPAFVGDRFPAAIERARALLAEDAP